MGWERQQRCSGSPQVAATPATSTATSRGGRPTLAAANEALKEKLAILQEENNVLRVQVGKTECDYAQHTEANHGKVVQALTDELRETAVQLSKLQGAEKRYERLVGELEAQHEEKVRSLTAELEQRDVRLVEAAESAERKLASAVAVKVRMVESRDEKLRELHAGAKEAALRLDDVRAEFVEERASLQAVCDERLSTIRSICGRLGGQPTVNRNDKELESMQGSSCTMSRTAMSR